MKALLCALIPLAVIVAGLLYHAGLSLADVASMIEGGL